eukprot:scaffold38322_cov191-Amphora_coffeaeformis.AAC.3
MVNMDQIGYDVVSRVLETWDSARRNFKDAHFEKEFGNLIICKFVELQPRSKKFYQGEEMMQKHADGIVHLLDSVLQMLGPDAEFIEEILGQVGVRHAKMGVPVSFFPFLGQSLIFALKKTIGDEMTEDHIEAWDEVYDAISGVIVKAILASS